MNNKLYDYITIEIFNSDLSESELAYQISSLVGHKYSPIIRKGVRPKFTVSIYDLDGFTMLSFEAIFTKWAEKNNTTFQLKIIEEPVPF